MSEQTGKPQHRLTEEQKRAIVVGLANFMTPAAVKVMMLAEYDLDLDFRNIVAYDPTRPAFRAGEHWREIHDIARKAHIEDNLSVPIAGQGFRLRSLQETHDKAKAQGNHMLVLQTLEHAAKEVGGLLTNARQLSVENSARSPLLELSPEERRAQAAEILRMALEKRKEEITTQAGPVVIEHQPKEGTTP